MVESDAAELARERRHLLPPAQMVAAGTVGENHRRPFAVDFIVEIDAADFCERHLRLLTKRNEPANFRIAVCTRRAIITLPHHRPRRVRPSL